MVTYFQHWRRSFDSLATMSVDLESGSKILKRQWVSWAVSVAMVCLVSGVAQAAMIQNLYEERLLVDTQSAQTLRRGAAEALERVLVRVSGQRNVRDNSVVAQALANAEPLLTQYRYINDNSAEDEDQLALLMSFSPRQVNGLLQSAGLPIWSSNRPSVLVWLVEDTASGRQFVSGDTPGALYEALQTEAQRRGVSLQFPLLDLVDTGNLSVADVWQMQMDLVKQASSRYGAPYVLVGRASELSNGQWVASWNLVQGQQELRLDSDGMGGQEAVAAVVDRIADTQARNFSVVAGTSNESTLIYVDGISDFHGYAGLVTYLENLSVIEHANTVWVSESALVVELVLNGDMEKVDRFLSLDKQLQSLDQSPRVVTEVANMPIRSFYHWRAY
ncbi:hypothetical protein IMCC21906_01433 [Spongiibacter sp. IMCC21906]|nr:hypothetical protein IMCC21906_01433 [Spongiibacter sp. IMCC21906]